MAWRDGTHPRAVGSLALGLAAGTLLLPIAAAFALTGTYVGVIVISLVGGFGLVEYSWPVVFVVAVVSALGWPLLIAVPLAALLRLPVWPAVVGYAIGVVAWVAALVLVVPLVE